MIRNEIVYLAGDTIGYGVAFQLAPQYERRDLLSVWKKGQYLALRQNMPAPSMQNNARAIPPPGEPRRLQIHARHTDEHIARTHAEYCQHVERPAHETLDSPRE